MKQVDALGIVNCILQNKDHPLSLGGHGLSDLSVLAGLTRLEVLNLRDNALTDVSDLADLDSLRELNLSANALTSLDGLSGLPALSHITASDNNISDVSGLQDAVGPLLVVDLQRNDLKPNEVSLP